VKQKGPDEVHVVLKAGVGMAQIQHRAKQLRTEQEGVKEKEKQSVKTKEAEKTLTIASGRSLSM
jgi:hypothetical protein